MKRTKRSDGIYRAKTLYDGWKLGLKNPEKYIGIPEHKFKFGSIVAEYEGTRKRFEFDDNELLGEQWDDKFGRTDRFGNPKKYRLVYFKWGAI